MLASQRDQNEQTWAFGNYATHFAHLVKSKHEVFQAIQHAPIIAAGPRSMPDRDAFKRMMTYLPFDHPLDRFVAAPCADLPNCMRCSIFNLGEYYNVVGPRRP